MIKGNLIRLIKVTKNNFYILYDFLINKEIMGPFQKTYKNVSLNKLRDRILNKSKKTYFLVRSISTEKNVGFIYYEPDARFNAMEIGGAIIPKERNKGYGFVSHRCLINFILKNRNVNRIQAVVSKKNKIEIKLLKKCGMILEGKLKKAGRLGTKLHDLVIVAILREEIIKRNKKHSSI